MTPVKRQYKNGLCKLLLLTVYLFFFAVQLSGRFYAIANFYVYGNSQVNKATTVMHLAPDGKAGTRYKLAQQDRSHLSLDKRFQGRYPIQATVASSLPALAIYADIRRKYAVCKQAVQSWDRIVISLRGPPVSA